MASDDSHKGKQFPPKPPTLVKTGGIWVPPPASMQPYTPPRSQFEYPRKFPVDLQEHVEHVRDREELHLLKHGNGVKGAGRYVKNVFVAFARQAIETQRRGIWSPIDARNHVEAFLRETLIRESYRLAFRGPRLPPLGVEALASAILGNGSIFSSYLKMRRRQLGGNDAETIPEPTVAVARAPLEELKTVASPEAMDTSLTMTAKEAAKALRVSGDTLDRMRRRGDIHMFKTGRRWKILASEVQRVRQQPRFKYR
jgi:excisionase family DNA binding protein